MSISGSRRTEPASSQESAGTQQRLSGLLQLLGNERYAVHARVLWLFKYVLPFGNTGELAARIFVLALLAGLILWFIRRPFSDRADFYRKCLYTVAALFLLSPTQFPWYYIWVLALLALSPRKSLLFLLTPLLSLYYLRFYFETRNMAYIFDNWIVWLEYLPVWVLLVRELFKKNDLEENSQHSVKTSP